MQNLKRTLWHFFNIHDRKLSNLVLIALWTVCKLHVHKSIREETIFSCNLSLTFSRNSRLTLGGSKDIWYSLTWSIAKFFNEIECFRMSKKGKLKVTNKYSICIIIPLSNHFYHFTTLENFTETFIKCGTVYQWFFDFFKHDRFKIWSNAIIKYIIFVFPTLKSSVILLFGDITLNDSLISLHKLLE